MDNPLYDWDKRLEGSIQLIKEDTGLSDHNKTQLLKFKRFLLVEKGLKPVRVVKYMSTLRIVLGWLGNKSCTDADKEDLLCIVEKIDSNGFKDWTKHDYKLVVRVFWQWLGKDDLVSWIKLNKANNSKLPEELLTPDEIQDMVNAANNARDRAFIAALYESNTRIGEFGSLRIKHIVFEIIRETLTAVLIVNGKTGMRRIRIVQSAPYLQEWIKQHPHGDDPEAWVWNNRNTLSSSRPVRYATFHGMLKVCAERAGIKKNVYFRLLNSKLPEELLTPDEIQDLVNAANNARDRALIAALYESNTRIGEFGSLRIKHIVFEIIRETLTAVLIVNGKTGMRRIRIVQSVPYLQEWIKQHPHGDDPEAWVWINLNSSKPIKRNGLNKMLKVCAERAGIKKNVYIRLLNSKLPEELLTSDEIQDLVNAANNARDRALIAALYESNTRIGEFGSLRIKHIVFEIIRETLTAVLIVNGKTGMRRIRIVQSAPYLQEWIKQHPHGDDPEAWVWNNLNTLSSSRPVRYGAFYTMLKVCAEGAGIKKNVHPHLLRHSRSTYLANHLTESQLCYYSGWVMGSNMAATYVHLSGKDIDNSILEMNQLGAVKETLANSVTKTLGSVTETPADSVNEIQRVGGRPRKAISGFTVDIYEFIKHNQGLTAVDIGQHFNRKNNSIRPYLHRLKNYGYLTNYNGKWYLAPAEISGQIIKPIAEPHSNFNINHRQLAEAAPMEAYHG